MKKNNKPLLFLKSICSRIQKYLISKFKYLKHIIKYYHTELTKIKESDLAQDEDRSVIDMFRDWILGITQYGSLIAILLVIFTDIKLNFILLIIGCGLGHWLLLDTLKRIKQALKW